MSTKKPQPPQPAASGITRRDLLKLTASAALGFTIVPRHVLGGPGYTPPSEQITRAIIGCGSMGRRSHTRYRFGPLLAMCDVDSNHLQMSLDFARQAGYNGVTGYHDFRELLLRDDIDVVHIATPPHWHAAMAIAAAEAGKDIWCEKPLTRTIGEGKALREAIRRTGRMLRVNTWFRFQGEWYKSGMQVAPLKKLADSGLLGSPLKMTVCASTGFSWNFDKEHGMPGLKEEPVPPELDYDRWLGPAPWKPYNSLRVHRRFRGYWDYDGGGLGDMGQHYLDPIQYIMGKDDTGPVEIQGTGPQQHPEVVRPFDRISLRYDDCCEIVLEGAPWRKGVPIIEGPNGKVFPGGHSDIPDLWKKLEEFPDPAPQITDFAESVKTRKPFALNERNGHRSCSLVNLAKIAVRLQRPLQYDPRREVFVNDEQANSLVDEPMRAPWII